MKYKVEVTAKDINKGRVCNGQYCPVALAVGRTGRFILGKIFVANTRVYAGDAKYSLPKKAIAFIEKFDEGRPVKPFSFVLYGD